MSGIQICGGQHHIQGYGKALAFDASGLVLCHRGCCWLMNWPQMHSRGWWMRIHSVHLRQPPASGQRGWYMTMAADAQKYDPEADVAVGDADVVAVGGSDAAGLPREFVLGMLLQRRGRHSKT